jgi:fructokinase
VSLRIVGIGEVLWDLLPSGPQLGGAPINFAYHAGALGAEAVAISRIGTDPHGDEIRTLLAERGIDVRCLQTDTALPTGTVHVTLASDGQPHYDIRENAAWDGLQVDALAQHVCSRADAICFGTLAQRSLASRTAIRTLVASTPATSLRILDVNLRLQFYSRELLADSLAVSNIVKVNDDELPVLALLFGLHGDERAQMAQMMERWDLRAVALTRGPRGALLYTRTEWSDHPGFPATVADTIGAGDSFTAAMTIGLLRGWPLDVVNERANRVASHVASSRGAMPVIPEPLRADFVS